MNESITKELRELIEEHWPHSNPMYREGALKFAPKLDRIADRIDARFYYELLAKQTTIDGLKSDNADLQAKLDASITLPLDADGVVWHIADEVRNICDGRPLRVVAIGWEKGRATIVYVDPADEGTLYSGRADKCRHVTTEVLAADGKPITVGETVYLTANPVPATVIAVDAARSIVRIKDAGGTSSWNSGSLTHTAPEAETIKDIRKDAESVECLSNLFCHADGKGISAAELVDRAYAAAINDVDASLRGGFGLTGEQAGEICEMLNRLRGEVGETR